MLERPIAHTKFAQTWIISGLLLALSSTLLAITDAVSDLDLLLPLTVGGFLSVLPFIQGAIGGRDIFSPLVLVSLLMFLGFYVAPALHLAFERYPEFLTLPGDVPEAFRELAILNVFSALFFHLATIRGTKSSEFYKIPFKNIHEIASWNSSAARNLIVAGWFSFVFFVWTILLSGGPATWISNQLNYRTDLNTPGWMLAIAEAFPTLFFAAYCIRLSESKIEGKALVRRVLLAIVILALMTFFSSGLRGSRANLIWPLLSGLILVHLLLVPLKRLWIFLAAVAMAVFASAYDIYKKFGLEALSQSLTGSSASSDIGVFSLITGDLSRSGIQMILLNRWGDGTQTLGYGRTYIGDALLFVPWLGETNAFPSKTVVGSDWLYGAGAASAGDVSSRIFGLQGEALLNFGPLAFVLIMIVFGRIVLLCDNWYSRVFAHPTAQGAVMCALFVPMVGLTYVSDMDNVFRYATSNVLLPLIAFWLASKSSRRIQSNKRT